METNGCPARHVPVRQASACSLTSLRQSPAGSDAPRVTDPSSTNDEVRLSQDPSARMCVSWSVLALRQQDIYLRMVAWGFDKRFMPQATVKMLQRFESSTGRDRDTVSKRLVMQS